MMRSVSLFLAGAAVALVVGYAVEFKLVRMPEGPKFLLDRLLFLQLSKYGGSNNGPGSGIRVVGGSITPRLEGRPIVSATPTSGVLSTFTLSGYLATSFELENVMQAGSRKDISFSESAPWTIYEYVNNGTTHGVQIDGNPANGTITMTALSGDSFDFAKLLDGQYEIGAYKNSDATCSKDCDKITTIMLNTTSYPCPDDGHCHVHIPAQ